MQANQVLLRLIDEWEPKLLALSEEVINYEYKRAI